MRVLHLIKATQIGGAERHLLILLKALRALSVDAQLLVLVEPDKPMNDFVAEAEVRGIPCQRLVIHNDLDLTIVQRIADQITSIKPDLLHTHLIHADTFGLPASRFANLPLVLTSRHNDDAFRNHPAMKLLNFASWRGYTGGIAISEAVRRFVIEIESAPEEKLHVVHYGIESEHPSAERVAKIRQTWLQELKLSDESLLIGMTCRLVEQKGVTYALQAVAMLHQEFPQAHLVIVGDGDLKETLMTEATHLEIGDVVHFMGWRANASQLMGGFDVFLMPSLWEGFGLVALEAMSQRVPVIASDISALPEVIRHGETGFLVPPRDATALAHSLRTLLADRALRTYMGLIAEDHVEQAFSASVMAQKTIAIYTKYILPTTSNIKKQVQIG